MEDEYERQRRERGAEAAEDGFGALRALPVGPEPREAGQQREHAKAPRSRLDRGEPTGDDEPEAGDDEDLVSFSSQLQKHQIDCLRLDRS